MGWEVVAKELGTRGLELRRPSLLGCLDVSSWHHQMDKASEEDSWSQKFACSEVKL